MKTSATILSLLAALPALAGPAPESAPAGGPAFHVILLYLIGVLCFVMVILVFTLYHVVNMMKREMHGTPVAETASVTEAPFWHRVLSLKPLANEKDLELDHDFDGIRELNNPIPAWFNVLFYGTIGIGFIYLVVYHIAGSAPLQAKEYENELLAAKAAREEYIRTAGNLVDENNVTVVNDPALLAQGQELYTAKCAVCHGDQGEGKVGPNLTDIYWLHGGDARSIFSTIKYGVPAKGMVAWQNSLNGAQMQQLTSFILSLQGTNPPGAKAPQGEAVQETGSTGSASAENDTGK